MQSVKEEWKPEYTEIVEKHDASVKSGEIKLKTFDSKEELFSYLHDE